MRAPETILVLVVRCPVGSEPGTASIFDFMKLTYGLLHSVATSYNGFNSAQLALLGVAWPPKQGWLTNLIGTEVPDETWNKIIELRGVKRKKHRRNIVLGTPSLFPD